MTKEEMDFIWFIICIVFICFIFSGVLTCSITNPIINELQEIKEIIKED